ncbi:hypothetical protein BVRB_4g071590 [Beta vulgaris subsp. vulgaris]|nr:hypothetical protein BVRB_4g071590 [Beta vulgaris subsp. vulgaris]
MNIFLGVCVCVCVCVGGWVGVWVWVWVGGCVPVCDCHSLCCMCFLLGS